MSHTRSSDHSSYYPSYHFSDVPSLGSAAYSVFQSPATTSPLAYTALAPPVPYATITDSQIPLTRSEVSEAPPEAAVDVAVAATKQSISVREKTSGSQSGMRRSDKTSTRRSVWATTNTSHAAQYASLKPCQVSQRQEQAPAPLVDKPRPSVSSRSRRSKRSVPMALVAHARKAHPGDAPEVDEDDTDLADCLTHMRRLTVPPIANQILSYKDPSLIAGLKDLVRPLEPQNSAAKKGSVPPVAVEAEAVTAKAENNTDAPPMPTMISIPHSPPPPPNRIKPSGPVFYRRLTSGLESGAAEKARDASQDKKGDRRDVAAAAPTSTSPSAEITSPSRRQTSTTKASVEKTDSSDQSISSGEFDDIPLDRSVHSLHIPVPGGKTNAAKRAERRAMAKAAGKKRKSTHNTGSHRRVVASCTSRLPDDNEGEIPTARVESVPVPPWSHKRGRRAAEKGSALPSFPSSPPPVVQASSGREMAVSRVQGGGGPLSALPPFSPPRGNGRAAHDPPDKNDTDATHQEPLRRRAIASPSLENSAALSSRGERSSPRTNTVFSTLNSTTKNTPNTPSTTGRQSRAAAMAGPRLSPPPHLSVSQLAKKQEESCNGKIVKVTLWTPNFVATPTTREESEARERRTPHALVSFAGNESFPGVSGKAAGSTPGVSVTSVLTLANSTSNGLSQNSISGLDVFATGSRPTEATATRPRQQACGDSSPPSVLPCFAIPASKNGKATESGAQGSRSETPASTVHAPSLLMPLFLPRGGSGSCASPPSTTAATPVKGSVINIDAEKPHRVAGGLSVRERARMVDEVIALSMKERYRGPNDLR